MDHLLMDFLQALNYFAHVEYQSNEDVLILQVGPEVYYMTQQDDWWYFSSYKTHDVHEGLVWIFRTSHLASLCSLVLDWLGLGGMDTFIPWLRRRKRLGLLKTLYSIKVNPFFA